MYLQITTKCNMTCRHCCYTCGPKGKHMTRDIWMQALNYVAQYVGEIISIGGGEPTCHPEFFEILGRAMDEFDYVWLATNGKKVKTMRRLANIIYNEDYVNTCDDDCEYGIYNEDNKLTVALSLDLYHESINPEIIAMWQRNNKNGNHNFEIKDSSQLGVIAAGRAKSWGDRNDCCCASTMITINGNLKMCGCKNAPIIGDIWLGEDPQWSKWMEKHNFYDSGCYNETLRLISPDAN